MKNKYWAVINVVLIASQLLFIRQPDAFGQFAPSFQKVSEDRANYLQFATLPMTSEIAQEKDILMPRTREYKPASSQPVTVEAARLKTTTEKLAVLADALFEQNIRGLAKQKLDDFMTGYLTAAAIELTEWLEDTNGDKDFQKLFHGTAPIYLVFLAMSPTSMSEYMDGLDMPGLPTDVMGDKKLPVNMSIKHVGENLIVEMWGAHDLSLTFKINSHNKVELIN